MQARPVSFRALVRVQAARRRRLTRRGVPAWVWDALGAVAFVGLFFLSAWVAGGIV